MDATMRVGLGTTKRVHTDCRTRWRSWDEPRPGVAHPNTCTTVLALLSAVNAAFLGSQLPLTLRWSQPDGLSAPNRSVVVVTGRQTLTALFSRPVVPLGANNTAAPFTLNTTVPGYGRWVTTYLYRWDPAVPWPPDTQAVLTWNTSLTSFDGVQLNATTIPATVRIASNPPVVMDVSVTSDRASNATGGGWSAARGDGTPVYEVPPDGKIQMTFSYPLSRSMLQVCCLIAS